MKRAPIVLTGTACGLVAVVGYHAATPQASALTSGSSGSTVASSLNAGGASKATATRSGTTASSASSSTSVTTGGTATTRSAVGSDVQYPYGDVEVKVTMTDSRITAVSVVKHDVTDPRSEMIDQYALPQLRSQALSVKSANIDGVSGASYTSAAYQQSLQSAIDKLKA